LIVLRSCASIDDTMKQKVFFLIGILLLAAVVMTVVKLTAGKSSKQGELQIESTPTASIFLNNKHIGRTPIGDPAYKVDPGEYTLKIVPESGIAQLASWQGNIMIGSGVLTYVKADLSDSELSNAINVLWLEKIGGKKSEISVTTMPDSATVILDDETKGMTPIVIPDVASGDHTITVTSQGFLTRTMKVQLTPGYRLVIALKLALTSLPLAKEEVSTSSALLSTKETTSSASISPTRGSVASLVEPEKPYALIKDTPTGYLNVRMEPNKTATKTAEVKPGEKYSYDKTETDSANTVWYEISKDGKIMGWISGQYVTNVE